MKNQPLIAGIAASFGAVGINPDIPDVADDIAAMALGYRRADIFGQAPIDHPQFVEVVALGREAAIELQPQTGLEFLAHRRQVGGKCRQGEGLAAEVGDGDTGLLRVAQRRVDFIDRVTRELAHPTFGAVDIRSPPIGRTGDLARRLRLTIHLRLRLTIHLCLRLGSHRSPTERHDHNRLLGRDQRPE